MNEVTVVEIGREALTVILQAAGPIMIAGMFVGLVIALFQALTTIQEMTLTFVPKIIVIFVSVIVMLPFMMSTVIDFANTLFERIAVIT